MRNLSTTTPAGLLSLPDEILATIITQLDTSTALSTSRTCRRLSPLSESVLWRELRLTGRARYDSAEAALTEEQEDEVRLPDLHKVAMKWQICEMLAKGDQRRWGMVERATVWPRPGSLHSLVQVLENVSSNLRELVIQSPRMELDLEYAWEPQDEAILELEMLQADLSFPSLTHVTIDHQSIRFAEFIPLLCNASPSLSHLDLNIEDQECEARWEDGSVTSFPPFARDTNITSLRILFGGPHVNATTGVIDEGVCAPVLTLLQRSPRLRRLSFHYDDTAESMDDACSEASGVLRTLKDLQFLYWHHSPAFLLDGSEHDFQALRSVVVEIVFQNHIFESMVAGPHLEIIHFDLSPYSSFLNPATYNPVDPKHFARAALAQDMIPEFAGHLYRSPKLHTISHSTIDYSQSKMEIVEHLQEVARSGLAAGTVSSWLHGKSEMLHVRLLLDIIEIEDLSAHSGGRYQTKYVVEYNDHDNGVSSKVFDLLQTPFSQVFTDFRGRCVPLEVIEGMRAVEGKSEKEWYQRGVEVGETTWKILADWHGGSAS